MPKSKDAGKYAERKTPGNQDAGKIHPEIKTPKHLAIKTSGNSAWLASYNGNPVIAGQSKKTSGKDVREKYVWK